MRLRNKKTGKIWSMPRLRQPTVQEDDISFFACIGEHGCSRGELFSYKSLAELNEEWEDYKPAEPLIKDEKVRNIVREWAKSNWSHELHQFNNYQLEDDNNFIIEFAEDCFTNLEVGKNYTITELCGEEEE